MAKKYHFVFLFNTNPVPSFALSFRYARIYFRSKMKRKTRFPFAFCSLIRNFVGEKTIDV